MQHNDNNQRDEFLDLGTFLRTGEIMHKVHEEEEAGSKDGGSRARPQGVLGEQMIFLFILCGMFLTTGWGGVMTLIMVALRVGMGEDPQEGTKQVPPGGQANIPRRT
jgi:hypothetical protein